MSPDHARLLEGLALADALLVLCEFDGTIAEYVADPASARPIDGALDTLARLGSLRNTRVAVISGRSLQSLRSVCGLDAADVSKATIELIGSAGMEIESQMTLSLTADARRMRVLLLQAAGSVAEAHPGVTVDEKPYGVALHVRGADVDAAHHAIERMLELATQMPHRVYTNARSEVLELTVLPVGQDWAIDALRDRSRATVFYAGNDDTAIASLSANDVSCSVGSTEPAATVCLDSPRAVIELLDELAHARSRVLCPS